jgi:indolepyruvate ferredoxin oxidoreductase
MAYKDEYEVARLYTAPEFRQKLERQFDGDYSLKVHLAPPMLSSIDPNTGLPRKREFGPWIFKAFSILAKLKSLRGTAFDVFGYTQERKTERKLIEDYAALLDEIAGSLAPENHGMAVQLARIPEQIRGFGHIKEKNIKRAKDNEAQLLASFRNPSKLASAAE